MAPNASVDFLHDSHRLEIINATEYGLLACVCIALIIYLRYYRATAYSGDDIATRKLILPSFEPLLCVITVISGTLAVYYTIVASGYFQSPLGSSVASQALFQGRQGIKHFIIAFFYQKSVSKQSMYRSLAIAILLTLPPLVMAAAFQIHNVPTITRFPCQMSYLLLLILGYLKFFFQPFSRATPTVWRQFCGFVLIYYALILPQATLIFLGRNDIGAVVLLILLVWDSLLPFFLWKLLRADTERWRGLSQSTLLLRPSNSTLLHEPVSSHGFHVLLELHHHHVVDFAHLRLNLRIAAGATSHVFQGQLYGKWPVAIKVYTPPEITEATIVAFSHEAALWAMLKHPNIAAFYGICVSPPSICLISELCEQSLADFLTRPHVNSEPFWLQLCLMLDAARAIAYLHSFSPPFLHRDIKPSNMVLDTNCMLKLTDFGESRGRSMDAVMSVRGTFDYMAPEVINGCQGLAKYTEQADVYSLAITFWDILHPSTSKYASSHQNHFRVFEMVLDGHRPPLRCDLDPLLVHILEKAWSTLPEQRSTAATIVTQLEELQRQLCQKLLAPKLCALFPSKASGNQLIQQLLQGKYALRKPEAIRLGNSLMDSGSLHHSHHKLPFEATNSAYLFQLISNHDVHDTCSCSQLFQCNAPATAVAIKSQWFPRRGQTEEDDGFYSSYRKLQYANTVGYGLLTLISVSIIIYLRRHRNTAYHGDATAAKKVILPAFEPLLWIVASVAFIYAAYYLIAAISSYNGPLSSPFFTEILYQGRQFINYVVVMTLLQTNLSRRSLYRALTLSCVLVIIPLTFTLFCTIYSIDQNVRYALLVVYRSIMVLGFIYLFIRPPSRGSPHAWRLFCGFVLVYYCSFFVQSQMLFVNDITGSTVCLFTTSLWYSMAPYWIWQLLKADTDHWRGLGQQALLVHKDTKVQEIVSAQGLHVLLEVHQQDVLDFALLKIGHKIGVGATSHVYRGVLSSKTDVAVKVYTPNEITESTIVEFSQETALCAALKHPNIVTFFGVCVRPPAICLVSELCDGSLEEFLSKAAPAYAEPLLARLILMLDAARAVAHLHSYSPPFLHRDLKPANFLLGHNHVLKLTDFGESRCMARAMDGSVRSMTIKGTAEYMAPEVIEGKQSQATYSETADIYSLAITLWDILHPGREKYPMQKKNHVLVFDMVLDGRRPPLDPELHPMLRDLLESAWCSSPEYRPSAQAI
ncbi:kinase, partial [Thraustotheca clavata]